MGLTNHSVGMGAAGGPAGLHRAPDERVIAIAGNPNVGKSTLFNSLTGMNQHTGNWPGKTVTNAQGRCKAGERSFLLVDIPGTYSLMAHSAEEEIARNFLCFGAPDAVVVVCDATCLERNLNLVLQTLEITGRAVVCVNLMDEAARKGVQIDLPALERLLGVPVVATVARKKKTLTALMEAVSAAVDRPAASPFTVGYCAELEEAVAPLTPLLEGYGLPPRWLALRLLEGDAALEREIEQFAGRAPAADPAVREALLAADRRLTEQGLPPEERQDAMVCGLVTAAERIAAQTVRCRQADAAGLDRKLDRVLTGRRAGYPVMLALLALILWLTIAGANVPSELLANALFWVQDRLTDFFTLLHAPAWLHGALVLGVYRTLAWVVSVMLPPMAIFFPLFTLLEDAGYLPRVAYNLDRPFRRCRACGKQALTMCMGFGCNAAGVVGCRIIDSPRERLIAVLTNSFVPCNGRFPILITVITLFFLGTGGGLLRSAGAALLLTAVILLGVGMTFLTSRLLSVTLLRGVPSSFTLELPPYRKPQIGQVLVRSIFDRTLFVLGRAAAVAAPAGLIIWLAANITVGDASLLRHAADFLDPFGRLLGMDGVILIAFILGLPANETVIPIMLMAYSAGGTLTSLSPAAMLALLTGQGWTWVTALCVAIFTLLHWPCSTTLLTIKKETGSWGWAALAALLPTAAGILCCFLIALIL